MLINVYQQRPAVIPGTRLLQETLGVVGASVLDPRNTTRQWEVQGLYMPISGRALGGIRVKLMDQKGFITFCNQRDFEVLAGMAAPGDPIRWREDEYVGPEDRDWFGLCCDEEDLLDDLYERELFLRAELPGGLLVPGMETERRVHTSAGNDCEELYIVTQDYDPETGLFPDSRFETLERRWIRSERRRVRWDRS